MHIGKRLINANVKRFTKELSLSWTFKNKVVDKVPSSLLFCISWISLYLWQKFLSYIVVVYAYLFFSLYLRRLNFLKGLHMSCSVSYTYTGPVFYTYSVQLLSCVQLFATPWIAAHQPSLSIANSRSSLKLISIESVTPSSHLILCRPLFLLSSCPQSLPVSESFPVSQLFTWGGQSTRVSALASFLPKNTQDWSPLEWTGWISLQSKGLSRVFFNTTVQKHQFFSAQLSSQSSSHIHTWLLEKP